MQVAIKFLERGPGVNKSVLREILNHRLCVVHPNIVQARLLPSPRPGTMACIRTLPLPTSRQPTPKTILTSDNALWQCLNGLQCPVRPALSCACICGAERRSNGS